MRQPAGFIILAVLALGLALSLGSNAPSADAPGDRRLSLYNIHNGERLDIVFKRGDTYDKEALKKLSWIFRDWRRNEATEMDPKAFDLLWEIYQELGSKRPIHVVSGYRSPTTNERLRKAGGGQAKNSQHILGKALDVHFADVSVQRLRYSALVRERGGVGYYPTSALPFVHIDTGRVRMWPRMPRLELAALFPSGRSKYIPDDGRPISLADVSAAKKNTKLYQTVAAFHALRNRDRSTTLLASAEPSMSVIPDQGGDDGHNHGAEQQVAMAEPVAEPVLETADSDAPELDGPALADAPAPQPVLSRTKQVASLVPPVPQLLSGKRKPAALASRKEMDALVLASLGTENTPIRLPIKKTTLAPEPGSDEGVIVPPEPAEMTMGTFLSRSGWARAPEFDEEHPDELSYRPFALAVFLTADASLDQPELMQLRHPDFKVAHDRLLDADAGLELSFKPEGKVAALIWDGQFAPEHVMLSGMFDGAATGKRVKTAKK
ncbi:MAG: DUF882 domain-containing protein [Hyphomicrobiaceae bacterium]